MGLRPVPPGTSPPPELHQEQAADVGRQDRRPGREGRVRVLQQRPTGGRSSRRGNPDRVPLGSRPGGGAAPRVMGLSSPPHSPENPPVPGVPVSREWEPSYAGAGATFTKLPLVLDPADLSGVDVAIVG